jgi:hypothetical protein
LIAVTTTEDNLHPITDRNNNTTQFAYNARGFHADHLPVEPAEELHPRPGWQFTIENRSQEPDLHATG